MKRKRGGQEEEGWERSTETGQTAGGLGVTPAVWICGL